MNRRNKVKMKKAKMNKVKKKLKRKKTNKKILRIKISPMKMPKNQKLKEIFPKTCLIWKIGTNNSRISIGLNSEEIKNMLK